MADRGERTIATLLQRGEALHDALCAWPGAGTPRLLKLVRAELGFLTRLSALPAALSPSCPALSSSNLDHLEAVFDMLKHSSVHAVSAVMQKFPLPCCSGTRNAPTEFAGTAAHVDIVCMFAGKPVWFVVSTRNPRYLTWWDKPGHAKGLKSRMLHIVRAASADVVTQPKSIVLCFAGEVAPEIDRRLKDEFGAIEFPDLEIGCDVASAIRRHQYGLSDVEGGEWVNVEFMAGHASQLSNSRSWVAYQIVVKPSTAPKATSLTITSQDIVQQRSIVAECPADPKVQACKISNVREVLQSWVDTGLSTAYGLQSQHPSLFLDQDVNNLPIINLDTTALVALVSEVSNGGAEFLTQMPTTELEHRFRSMSSFIVDQALSEMKEPLLPEMVELFAQHQPVISQYVFDEFSSIVSVIGGSREKKRAEALLADVKVVSDNPSDRILALPESGKIKARHKIVFGTGDSLGACTVTANLAFVRAVRQTGMAISVYEHRPRALTGD